MASIFSDNRISKINLGNVDYHIKSIPFNASEQEWADKDYVPSNGELIVVNDNAFKFKLGDGQNTVNNLPYANENILNGYATKDYVADLYKNLFSNNVLRFYCIEDVIIILNGVSTTYAANSNVEVKFLDTDEWEIVPTSDNSILALNGFPGALGTFYPWLEGVKQFSNILFDMNNEDMYVKWNQNNQGTYQVQFAQYINCIFWSDLAYVHEITKRTNYTLYYSSQLPLCYSNIPDNTFKAFFLAFGVNSDPNWGNPVYRESFSKATWATQAFSYYGARTIGVFGHDSGLFNIVLPPDCRGLFCEATAVENAGTFDAINVTNFGAKSGSWRDAFRMCISLRHLYIKNLKVNLNVSWSPINYDSITYIISEAANTNAITISVSPYTYYLLKEADFELAASKNITIELLTVNYAEDKRLGEIANKAEKNEVLLKTEQTLTNEELIQIQKNLKFATEEYVDSILQNDIGNYFFIVETIKENGTYYLSGITFEEIIEKFNNGGNMVCHVDGTDYIPLLSVTSYKIIFSGIYNTTSVSLDFDTTGAGVLTSTYLGTRAEITTAKTEAITTSKEYTDTAIENIASVDGNVLIIN